MTSATAMGIRPAWLDFTPASELSILDGVAFDEGGCGPYHLVPPCPNCDKGGGWLDALSFVGALNGGHDPGGCCSRKCLLQWEHARGLAAEAGGEVDELALRPEVGR